MAMCKTIMWNHTDYGVCVCECTRGREDFCETRISAHPLLKLGIMTTPFLTHIKDCISSLKALRVSSRVFFSRNKATVSDNLNLRKDPRRFKITVMKTKSKKKSSDESYAIHSNELTGDECRIYMPAAFTALPHNCVRCK